MERKKMRSIKWDLFIHLIVALFFSVVCSVLVNITANRMKDSIWLNYIDDISGYYEMYNEYFELYGDVIAIPQASGEDLTEKDAIIIGLCDFSITWGSFIFTSIFVLAALTRFYKKRLKKPLDLLESSATRIGNQDLDFQIDYRINDEMGHLCIAFEKMREQLYINSKTMWKMIDDQKQMRSAFSHDLRTPMSVLKAYVEYLSRYFPEGKLSDEKVVETLEDLNEQIVRIEKFADTMKEVNDIDEIQPQKSRTSSEIIEKKTNIILKTLLNEKEKTCKLSCQWECATFLLDLDIYLEIVENVVANAVRFANSKIGVEIVGGNDQLSIVVYDDGPGFQKDELSKATKPYYHGNDREGIHYGMGLYISAALCKKHGGKLSLNNLSSGGACVRIVLDNVGYE